MKAEGWDFRKDKRTLGQIKLRVNITHCYSKHEFHKSYLQVEAKLITLSDVVFNIMQRKYLKLYFQSKEGKRI